MAFLSPEIMYCREYKVCGFVYDHIFVEESMPNAWMQVETWTEFQLNEKLILLV